MFIASVVYGLALLIISALVAPSLIGKVRKPITGGDALLSLLLNGLFAGAVYIIWHDAITTGALYVDATVIAGVLWAVPLAGTLTTIAKIGKPRQTMTTRTGVCFVAIQLLLIAMLAGLIA